MEANPSPCVDKSWEAPEACHGVDVQGSGQAQRPSWHVSSALVTAIPAASGRRSSERPWPGPAPRAHTPPRRRAPVGPPWKPSSPSNIIMRLVRPSAERSGAKASSPVPCSNSASNPGEHNERESRPRGGPAGAGRAAAAGRQAALRAPNQAHSCSIILLRRADFWSGARTMIRS